MFKASGGKLLYACYPRIINLVVRSELQIEIGFTWMNTSKTAVLLQMNGGLFRCNANFAKLLNLHN